MFMDNKAQNPLSPIPLFSNSFDSKEKFAMLARMNNSNIIVDAKPKNYTILRISEILGTPIVTERP